MCNKFLDEPVEAPVGTLSFRINRICRKVADKNPDMSKVWWYSPSSSAGMSSPDDVALVDLCNRLGRGLLELISREIVLRFPSVCADMLSAFQSNCWEIRVYSPGYFNSRPSVWRKRNEGAQESLSIIIFPGQADVWLEEPAFRRFPLYHDCAYLLPGEIGGIDCFEDPELMLDFRIRLPNVA